MFIDCVTLYLRGGLDKRDKDLFGIGWCIFNTSMRSKFFEFAIAPINHQSEKEKKKNDVQGTEKKAT